MKIWTLILLLAIGGGVHAAVETHQFDDPAQEARYKVLIDELRCLVCQNQNLADSNAELAQDLRQQTYEMVRRGASNEEVITYMVERYGDFVLYRPPVRGSTLLLWIGPFLILALGVFVLLSYIRSRSRERTAEITPEQRARAESLLNTDKSS